jgi:TPR repeat protein
MGRSLHPRTCYASAKPYVCSMSAHQFQKQGLRGSLPFSAPSTASTSMDMTQTDTIRGGGGHATVAVCARMLESARESSGKGSRYGQFALGRCEHQLHQLGAAGQRSKAAALHRLAAAQGLDAAQYSLGVMYHADQGVDRDYAEALRWFQLAAAQGHPGALYKVAVFHESGLGVAADVAAAIRWYRRAQTASDINAARDLRRLRA